MENQITAMTSDYHIVTVCSKLPTAPYYCLREWAMSLRGKDIVMLGAQPGEYKGLGDKPKLVYKAMQEGYIDRKYIIFCDCFDLVFACDTDEVMEVYKTFNSPLVISSEKNCFPDTLKYEYDKLPYASSYRYLNSGMIIGETEALREVLLAMDVENIPDDYRNEDGSMTHINDQFLYQEIFLKQPVPITLDYNQILCNTLYEVQLDELDFSKERIKNKETGVYPCSFHANGNAKTGQVLSAVLSHLKLI